MWRSPFRNFDREIATQARNDKPIFGGFSKASNNDRDILYKLAQSEDLWERRIAIVSTFHFIKHGEFDDTLVIAEHLLNDKHDLIHKAVGGCLREVVNRNMETEESFWDRHIENILRTMVRYAIEKMPEDKRQSYLLK